MKTYGPTMQCSGKTLNYVKSLKCSICLRLAITHALSLNRAGLIIRGLHTNVRRGPFLIHLPRIFFLGVQLSSSKKSTTFLGRLHCTFKRSNVCGKKNLAVDRGPLAAGLSHGTTDTMDNPALSLNHHRSINDRLSVNQTLPQIINMSRGMLTDPLL